MPEMREIFFFKKRIPNMRYRIIYILPPPPFFFFFLFGGMGVLLSGVLASVFFLIFGRWPTMMADIFTQIKLKASNGPAFSLVLSKNVNSCKTYISFHKTSLILPFFHQPSFYPTIVFSRN